MPVDKFGRMDDVKTSGDGVSLAYISNNFLRKDGTTTVTGSINMNGNTLTRVSNPVNPQDVATKSYVDGNSGLLDENGGYHMVGYLNMGFNKIKNIADPEEPSEAATKKYVDNSGRAIVQKQQDGTFCCCNINMRIYLYKCYRPCRTTRCCNKIRRYLPIEPLFMAWWVFSRW